MIFFHQCLEQMSCFFKANKSIAEKLSEVAFRKKLLEHMRSATCFDVGCFAEIQNVNHTDGVGRLPYDRCWFEGDGENGGLRIGIYAFSPENDDFKFNTFFGFQKDKKDGWFLAWIAFHDPVSNGFSCVNEELKTQAMGSIYAIMSFLSAMSCVNVVRVEMKPDEKLQKARNKKGRLPLFSYWTLRLKGVRSGGGSSLGGTHESPRVHLRRGHPRQFAPGRWTWVQPCVVGSPERGMVHKDYDGSRLSGVAS